MELQRTQQARRLGDDVSKESVQEIKTVSVS